MFGLGDGEARLRRQLLERERELMRRELRDEILAEQAKAELEREISKPARGAPYRCPNPGCQHIDSIAKAIISRPVVGEPWRHDEVGALVMCARCGLHFCVTVDGIYQTDYIAGVQAPRAPVGNQMVPGDAFIEDLRRPSYPGV